MCVEGGLEWLSFPRGQICGLQGPPRARALGLWCEAVRWDSWIPRPAGLGTVPRRGQSWGFGGVRCVWGGAGRPGRGLGELRMGDLRLEVSEGREQVGGEGSQGWGDPS